MAPTPINKRVQFPRGTTDQVDNYTGPNGQVVVDVVRRELRLQDGKKKGGWVIPNLTDLRKIFLGRESEFAGLQFPGEAKGFLARTADRIFRLRIFAGGDGLTVDNEDGVGGDPTVRLPKRLRPEQEPLLDANLAVETGFYIVQKGANSNLPPDFNANSDGALAVFNYKNTAGGTILQVAYASQTSNVNIYSRRLVDAVWTGWLKREDPIISAVLGGNQQMILDGVDEVPRLWSARDISMLVRRYGLESIQFIDGANAAKAFSYNQVYQVSGTGLATSQQIAGPIAISVNDRLELVASATAVKSSLGDNQVARIEVEHTDGSWNQIAALAVAIGPEENTKSVSITARIIRNATGSYQIADANWNPTSTVAATVAGRFRLTVGTATQAGARIARFR